MPRLPRIFRSAPDGPPAPFVVASPRSGTTLLRMMLDAHSELAIPSETHFVPELIDAFSERRLSPDETLELLREHRRWGDFHLEPAELLARLREREPLDAGASLRAFFSLYAQSQGKRRWGDKTPEYVEAMRPISRALPEARFVHVIRDGRDVAMSRVRWRMKRAGKRPPMERLAKRWKKAITGARKQGERLPHYLEVRYEDLIADTEATLRRVCEFVELDFDDAMLAYHERAAERLAEIDQTLPETDDRVALAGSQRLSKHEMTTKPPERERIFAWRGEMSEEDLATFEAVAGDLLRELDYPVGDGARDRASAVAEG